MWHLQRIRVSYRAICYRARGFLYRPVSADQYFDKIVAIYDNLGLLGYLNVQKYLNFYGINFKSR